MSPRAWVSALSLGLALWALIAWIVVLVVR